MRLQLLICMLVNLDRYGNLSVANLRIDYASSALPSLCLDMSTLRLIWLGTCSDEWDWLILLLWCGYDALPLSCNGPRLCRLLQYPLLGFTSQLLANKHSVHVHPLLLMTALRRRLRYKFLERFRFVRPTLLYLIRLLLYLRITILQSTDKILTFVQYNWRLIARTDLFLVVTSFRQCRLQLDYLMALFADVGARGNLAHFIRHSFYVVLLLKGRSECFKVTCLAADRKTSSRISHILVRVSLWSALLASEKLRALTAICLMGAVYGPNSDLFCV